jgi:hypothetical protein
MTFDDPGRTRHIRLEIHVHEHTDSSGDDVESTLPVCIQDGGRLWLIPGGINVLSPYHHIDHNKCEDRGPETMG